VTFVTKQQKQKIVQYLNEAHSSELALVRQLQAQIAMTPRGSYRDGLETHLQETRRHAERVDNRLGELDQGKNPLKAGLGAVWTVAGQALALTKTPVDLVRGSGGEEKVLKNAKDSCAAEALEIATYTALARLAHTSGDAKTERLAKSIAKDEQRMLDLLLREIPRLTDAMARAQFDGEGSYELTETGAADAVREAGDTAKRGARRGAGQAKRTARQARKVPGVARAEGTVKGAVASESDLPIPGFDSLSANEVQDKLSELSQIDLAKVDSYERKHENRTTVLERVTSLRGDEPWSGYDELTVSELETALGKADDDRVKTVRAYERAHKARAGVLKATERELATA
jgi:ferritin-like metal-binding protein YciE